MSEPADIERIITKERLDAHTDALDKQAQAMKAIVENLDLLKARVDIMEAHVENLIQRVADLEARHDPEMAEVVWERDHRDNRPHSRACGIHPHPHGSMCSNDCPTCGVESGWRGR